MEEELQSSSNKWFPCFLLTVSRIHLVFVNPFFDHGSVHISSAFWLMMQPMLVPLLEKLPDAWTTPWLQ